MRALLKFLFGRSLSNVSHAVIAVDDSRGKVLQRPLLDQEVTFLRSLFLDTLDYAAIRLQFGGMKSAVKLRPHTVGNDIWMGRGIRAGGTSGIRHLELLAHEAAHVWQFQNLGIRYIWDALWAQGFGDGYNWRKALTEGRAFEAMNPEQQAEIMALMCVAMHLSQGRFDPCAESALTSATINDAIRILAESGLHREADPLSNMDWKIIEGALKVVRREVEVA